ncbi:MAG: hypothetical protein SFZ02_00090 [bacterium]|nr:hypothetical protein [bacterium]
MFEQYNLEQDLKELEAMVSHLAPYLKSSELYGNAGGGFFSKMPALTIGAVVMRLRRLEELRISLTTAQRDRFDKAKQSHEAVYREWKTHYEKKLLREAHSRLDAMRTFFEECENDPRLCAQVYSPEVLRRTIVQEIILHMNDISLTDETLPTKITGVDGRLRRYVRPNDFFWDKTLETAYPQADFWWLYQRPVGKER